LDDIPRIPLRIRLLRSLLRASVLESAVEDFEEHRRFLAGSKGRLRALSWFWIQVICLIPVSFKDTLIWSLTMFKNHLKIALRGIKRQKGYSVINISGLAIGIACCILILLWVRDELGYDGFHEDRDSIYRIVSQGVSAGVSEYYAVTPLPLGPALQQEYPEVVKATRYNGMQLRLRLGSETHAESGTLVDPDFIRMFSFGLLQGDKESCLNDPFSIILTERLAGKYFGTRDPVGQVLTTQAGTDLKVSGVMKNVPHNSHLRFDFLIPFEILARLGRDLNNWEDVSYFTYVMLERDANVSDVNRMIEATLDKYRERRDSSRYLQPLKDIHLRSHFKFDIEGHGDIRYVYIFSAAAALILTIACINFMNLATARSAGRAKEVGIRKVVGAHRSHIVRQFFGESTLLTMVAFLASLAMVRLLLPVFNVLSGKPLVFDLRLDPALYGGLLGILLFTGLLSGSYPAVFLSAFRPVRVLRGRFSAGGKGALFRRVLVVTQFSLSIILVIGTLGIYHQIHYMKNANLGFATDHLIYIPMSQEVHRNYDALRIELLRNPSILNVTAVDSLPIYEGSGTSKAEWEGKSADFQLQMRIGAVDYDFLETFGLGMVQGSFFSREITTDSSQGFVINEAAVKAMGLEDPIGKRFGWRGRQGRIIGIIQDYQLRTLHYEVEPLAIFIDPDWLTYLCVKLDANNVPRSLAFLGDAWGKHSPEDPFQFRFFDDDIDTLYRAEERIGTLFKYFTLLAVFISCLGLFGLASYLVEQRTKEIGIRKVLGASVPRICVLLSQEFFKWVVIANLIAWPAAYFVTEQWLQSFAHRAGFALWIFVLSGVLSFTAATAAIGYQSVRAALINPARSLRYE
jgi:ABC-type antimicrobial peptide transport system permease subunit